MNIKDIIVQANNMIISLIQNHNVYSLSDNYMPQPFFTINEITLCQKKFPSK